VFGASAVVVLSLAGPHGSGYASELLPGQLLAGLGIGLAFPTLLSSATHDLPAPRGSTGSGVITMTRQLGVVLGVSIVVAILGAPAAYDAARSAFVNGWWAVAVVEFAAALSCLGMLARRQPAR
jgi:fucose permease